MSVAGTPAVVSVSISSSLNSFRALKRYARGLTIAEFKCKLELVVGSPASCMELELYTPDDKFRSHLGQYNKEEMSRKESELEQKLVEEKALAEAIPVGARCEVR
ncbi:putative Tubulin-folding cofactor B protein, partial [Naja naja]